MHQDLMPEHQAFPLLTSEVGVSVRVGGASTVLSMVLARFASSVLWLLWLLFFLPKAHSLLPPSLSTPSPVCPARRRCASLAQSPLHAAILLCAAPSCAIVPPPFLSTPNNSHSSWHNERLQSVLNNLRENINPH